MRYEVDIPTGTDYWDYAIRIPMSLTKLNSIVCIFEIGDREVIQHVGYTHREPDEWREFQIEEKDGKIIMEI